MYLHILYTCIYYKSTKKLLPMVIFKTRKKTTSLYVVWVGFKGVFSLVHNIEICIRLYLHYTRAGGSVVKNLSAKQEIQVWSLGWKYPLEKEMATGSSILAWEIPWTEEPGRLQSIVLQRIRHVLATKQHNNMFALWLMQSKHNLKTQILSLFF